MKIYDISMTIEKDMPVYKDKNEKKPIINTTTNNDSTESKISLGMHTGTHMDMPMHFVKNGKTIDTLELIRVITPCKVLDFTYINGAITSEDLKKKNLEEGDFILFKTKNSYSNVFDFDFVYLNYDGAEFLNEINIKGVGIDSLGIERSQPNHQTHKILLKNEIIIIEGLRLKGIEEGIYKLIALPLKIKGVEASPIRAVLLKD
ncbi:MAG: cyclase family protein [Bacillota bacterium]|nr:cyclase family protein [Bacillota bacterium]